MSAPNLAEIVRLARETNANRVGPQLDWLTASDCEDYGHEPEDAAYIAALSPSVVLAWAEHTERMTEALREIKNLAITARSGPHQGPMPAKRVQAVCDSALAGRSEGETT